MHGIPNTNRGLDKLPITIILRLVMNNRGVILHGEIVDVKGIPITRFYRSRGLARALHRWATAQRSSAQKRDKTVR